MRTRALFVVFLLLSLVGLAQAELQVQRVWPEKIFYSPGERVALEVTVANPDQAAASARLAVELVHDIDTAVPLTAQEITVEPGKTFTWRGSWKAQPWLGIELRATLRRGETAIARRSDYFTCAENVWQVMMSGRGNHGGLQFPGAIDDSVTQYAVEFPAQWRAQYGNFTEQFAWGPSDFDCLTPKEDRWWAGQTSYSMSKTNIVATYNGLHKQGIQVLTYGKAAGGGITAFENLRRRPELTGYYDGRPWLENYSAAYLDFIETIGPPKPGDTRYTPGTPEEMEKAGYKNAGWYTPYTPGGCNWCAVWYSCTQPEALAIGINELNGSAAMFGFDGVRFDGEFVADRHQTLDGSFVAGEKFDVEAANVALVKRMKAEIWKAHPNYLFGYNGSTQITWSIAANNVPASFREKCKDGGLFANEGLAFPGDVPWLDYAHLVRHEAEIVRYYGGHHATYSFDRAGNRPYNFIINFALGSHVYNWYQGPTLDNADFNRFGTRFATLLWDSKLRYWPAAAQQVTVTADRPLLWQPFAAARPLPGKSTQFILHLINPPEGKTTFAQEVLPAAPARDATVTVKAPNGFTRAFLINFPSCEIQPLAPKRAGDKLVFNVAQIPYWAMLVIEAKTPTPAPVYEKATATTTVATPSAEDLQLTPKAATPGKPSWRDVLEPDKWGGGETIAERLKDPDALNGSAVRGRLGTPQSLMADTYSYPRIPGKFRATFRLKVVDNTVDKPVFRLNIDDWVMHPLPGVPKLPNPTLEVKATDFKQPNVYQEFTIPFEHADMGFMGVNCTFLGNVVGSWDRVVLELVEPWSDARLAEHYKSMAAPADLQLQRDDKLDVLAVRGLWNRLYDIDEAAKLLPGQTAVSNAYTTFHQQHDTQLSGFKFDWQPLFTQDVIVLANVETRGLALGQVRMIGEFVRQGGGLLILGGLTTLGQTNNMERGWPDFLPITLNGPWEIRKCTPPVQLAGSDSQHPSVVLYRHMVTAKPGSTLLLQGTKGEPLLVGTQYGKGRVAVFTGTVLGEPGAGQTACWTAPEWPQQLANALSWVAGKAK